MPADVTYDGHESWFTYEYSSMELQYREACQTSAARTDKERIRPSSRGHAHIILMIPPLNMYKRIHQAMPRSENLLFVSYCLASCNLTQGIYATYQTL